MADRLSIPSKELALKVVGPLDSFFASRVQRISMNTDVPNTVVDEHGNSSHAGIVGDIPNVTLTFSAFDVSIKIFAALTGTDPTSYPGGGVNIDELGEVDAILYVKSATTEDYVKSAHARRLQIRDFSYSYSVTGESTEDYTAVGSEKRWFKNDIIVDRFTGGGTSETLTETPIQLKNSNYLLSVIADGVYLTEVAAGEAAGQYSVSGTTLSLGAAYATTLIAVYHANPAGTNWSDVSDSTIPVAIRGKDVKVVISASEIPRVQSVTINGNLNPQPIKEMGSQNVVGYQRQVPTVEGTITVLDTDTELIDLLTTGEIGSGDTEFSPGEGCLTTTVSLKVRLYDPCASGTILKTLYIPQLRIVGDSYTSNINDNAQQVFNFQSETAELYVYSGSY